MNVEYNDFVTLKSWKKNLVYSIYVIRTTKTKAARKGEWGSEGGKKEREKEKN